MAFSFNKLLIFLITFLAIASIVFAVGGGGSSSGSSGGGTPVQVFDESELQCDEKQSTSERIDCRIDLPLNYEKLDYLPEECRNKTGNDRYDCLTTYESVQPCWLSPAGTERENCVKEKLELGNILEEKSQCSNINCLQDLRKKVYKLVKFRFYDLEEKAIKLLEFGVSRQDVTDLMVKMEQQKLNFNNSGTMDKRVQVVKDAQNDWQSFKNKAIPQIKNFLQERGDWQ